MGAIASVVVGLLLVALGASLGRREERRKWENQLRGKAREPSVDPDHQERVEQAIEAIALEVERIGEGQRFVTKLLAERGGVPDGRRQAERINTPH